MLIFVLLKKGQSDELSSKSSGFQALFTVAYIPFHSILSYLILSYRILSTNILYYLIYQYLKSISVMFLNLSGMTMRLYLIFSFCIEALLQYMDNRHTAILTHSTQCAVSAERLPCDILAIAKKYFLMGKQYFLRLFFLFFLLGRKL